jgi:hypothetical protein
MAPGGGDSRPVMLSDYIIVIGGKGHDFRKKNRLTGVGSPEGCLENSAGLSEAIPGVTQSSTQTHAGGVRGDPGIVTISISRRIRHRLNAINRYIPLQRFSYGGALSGSQCIAPPCATAKD